MIDIIFLAVIAGVLIIRLLMVLGEKRDDDPTPPFSLLDATKKKPKVVKGQVVADKTDKGGNGLPAHGDAPLVVEESEPLGFYLKGGSSKAKSKSKNKAKDGKDETETDQPLVVEDSKDPRWAAAWDGIMTIKARDDGFLAADFLAGAEKAFEVTLDCFVRGDEVAVPKNKDKGENKNEDKDKGKEGKEGKAAMSASALLKEYVSPELLNGFLTAMKERDKNGYHQEQKNLIGIRQSMITEATVDEQKKICQIKILFESDQIYALYDKDNKLVEGDDSTIIPKKDTWVFERKMTMTDNGRWWLVAVEE